MLFKGLDNAYVTYDGEGMTKALGGPRFVEIAGMVLNASEVLRVDRMGGTPEGAPEHVRVYFVNSEHPVVLLRATLEEVLGKLSGV